MIHTKDHKTMDLSACNAQAGMFDPFDFLGPKRRKLINDSWAKICRDEILPDLPVHLIMPHYHASKGRSSKELYAMLGLMVLQQMHDLTDEDAASQYAFNIQWHFALNITGSKDTDTYLPVRRTQTGACPKTIWSMRDILTEKNLYTPLFDSVTDKLAKVFAVDTDKQRYDSMHIFSNMRHLGRLGLFVKTIKKFLVNLKRHHIKLYEGLEKELVDRHMTKDGENLFSMVKPSESERTLEILGEDLFSLMERLKQDKGVTTMSSYKLLTRLLKDQCIVEEGLKGKGKKVLVKPNKDVPSDSLQSPSDPDAGYSGHKGKGYQVQVAETYNDDNDNKEDKKTLSLITHVKVEPANKSDSDALVPIIEATQKKGLGPKEVLVDSLYGGDENCEKAKELCVEVISPTMGKEPEKALTLSDFTLCESGIVKTCPAGKEPIKTKKNKKGKQSAVFKSEACLSCSHLNDCPVKPGKEGHYLRYDDKMVRLSRRRTYEKTEEFSNKYRFRAGVEATMSYYDRKTGVKRLRVRGLKAVSFSATLKAIGVNIFRAATFKNSDDRKIAAIKGLVLSGV
jgi:Transposase DDE domain